jgi:nickel-dependent lactate racemase
MEGLLREALSKALAEGKNPGPVLVLPPDITRFYSRAGFLTDIAYSELGSRLGAVMPALGTHTAMTGDELKRMFPRTPAEKFLVHDWRRDVVELGRLEADWVEKTTEGKVSYDWPVQVNKLLCDGGFSLIVSIGQVVPHEVIGMANHTKNLFVGTGGKEAIDKSHFAGATFGMEKMMGRIDTPVRSMFDEGFRRFGDHRSGGKLPPVLFVLTVVGPRKAH